MVLDPQSPRRQVTMTKGSAEVGAVTPPRCGDKPAATMCWTREVVVSRMREPLLLIAIALFIGCGKDEPPPAPPSPTEPAERFALGVGEGPRGLPGLANVCRVSDKLLSGGMPEGDEGFG